MILYPTSIIRGNRAINEPIIHYIKRSGGTNLLKQILFSPSENGIIYTRRYGIIYIYSGIKSIFIGIKQIILK
jgi:hypothetical protein